MTYQVQVRYPHGWQETVTCSSAIEALMHQNIARGYGKAVRIIRRSYHDEKGGGDEFFRS